MTKRPIVLDLFSGVGGLSLGAARAGFEVAAAVDNDRRALATHRINFPHVAHLARNISQVSANTLLDQLGLRIGKVAGVIGGPPCQGFSTIGRRDANDPRNDLLERFFRLVSQIRPAFFLAENVPGLLAPRNAAIRESALRQLDRRYTVLAPIVVRASEYGVPTVRTRVFFVGYDSQKMGSITDKSFAPQDVCDVRVSKAMQKLPRLRSEWQSEDDSWRVVGELGSSHFEARIKGFVPRRVGDEESLRKYRSSGLTSGFLGTHHTKRTVNRFARLRPGESDEVSRSVRLDLDGYCPTIRAGTGPDRGSYQSVRPIHPRSPRVICPREAARLQGFPDWFQFDPTKWHAFRQIGNSVSPIVAEYLLRAIRQRVD